MKPASCKRVATTGEFGLLSNSDSVTSVGRGKVDGHVTINAVFLRQLNEEIGRPSMRTVQAQAHGATLGLRFETAYLQITKDTRMTPLARNTGLTNQVILLPNLEDVMVECDASSKTTKRNSVKHAILINVRAWQKFKIATKVKLLTNE